MPGKPIEQAIDSIELQKRQAEWVETHRLAEQVFPPEWNVKVVPLLTEAYVVVSFTIAHGRDPIDALKNAITAHRQQTGSRIVLPGRG